MNKQSKTNSTSVKYNFCRIICVISVLVITMESLVAQREAGFSGIITDENRQPLQGASITLNETVAGAVTNREGRFQLSSLISGWYLIEVSYLGYEKFSRTIHLPYSGNISIQLVPVVHELREININNYSLKRQREATTSIAIADRAYLQRNESGSLMQTLSRLPGVSSMDIGSGNSKPVIRGLGFNRIVVAENGLKHEGQEWGHDHGLEIDQESVERIEIIKGPASLRFGSNAITGVIDIKQLAVPARNSSGITAGLRAASNNKLIGFSGNYFKRYEHFYWKVRFNALSYADYKVPADSIEYLSYYFRLKNRQLRNTAGREYSAGATLGMQYDNFSSHLSISNIATNSGFFANAHGLEIRNSTIDYDTSDRDIDLPSQQVNHLKILSNSFYKGSFTDFQLDLGFQHNLRNEYAEPIPHGYMPVPPDSLERHFSKTTASAHFSARIHGWEKQEINLGFNTEQQNNRRGGWGFIIPDFRTTSAGVYATDQFSVTENLLLSAGLRYDLGYLSTSGYRDWYTTPIEGVESKIERAWALQRTFQSTSWSVGASYTMGDLLLKANIGKSFRTPNVKELASNGLNYHMYRYETGDSTLQAEESYQLDLGVNIKKKSWELNLSPFINYFPNYIYLNPTARYYDAQQVFYYRQSEVFRTGGELSLMAGLTPHLSWKLDMEYVYSLQLSGEKKGYTLPFSPPFNATTGFHAETARLGQMRNPYAGIELQLTASQNQIVPPEKKTPGFQLIHLRAGGTFQLNDISLLLSIQVRNLLNTRYYDHTSFYRLIEVPGPGRNILASLSISI